MMLPHSCHMRFSHATLPYLAWCTDPRTLLWPPRAGDAAAESALELGPAADGLRSAVGGSLLPVRHQGRSRRADPVQRWGGARMPHVHAVPHTHSTRTHGAQHRAVDCCNQRVDGRCVAQVTSLSHTPHAQNITLHVSDLAIAKVATMTFDSFSVTLSYKATWSDRYAVHPCAINLYDTGRGVVRRFARSARLLIRPSPPADLPWPNLLTRSCFGGIRRAPRAPSCLRRRGGRRTPP